MKKEVLVVFFAAIFVLIGIASVSASCILTPTLVSQDPYPAVPGDYVKLVFQVSGMANPDCGQMSFQLVPSFPISFDPGTSSYFDAKGGIYAQNYNSNLIIPYKVKVNSDAIDGNNTINFRYMPAGAQNYSVNNYFNISIQDVKSSFEVYVKNYVFSTKDLTLEILNTGKNDVNALTVQLAQDQPNATVEGSNVDILGSLSSYDYTTSDFTVSPKAGYLNLNISYNDVTGTRRSVEKSVYFDPSNFQSLSDNQRSSPVALYIILGVVVLIIVYIIYRRHKKNKKKKLLRE